MNMPEMLEFKKIFGKPITNFATEFPKMSPMASILLVGLNIIKFDEWINPPDGTSCADEVEKRYGVEARKLIEKLIGGK